MDLEHHNSQGLQFSSSQPHYTSNTAVFSSSQARNTTTMANQQHSLGTSATSHLTGSSSHLNAHAIPSAGFESDSEASLIHLAPRPPLSSIPQGRSAEDDSRRCWVCYSTEAEDLASPQPHTLGEWKSPCRCSLVAHEKCLLNWIAAEYAKGGKAKIECPQCKHKIRFKQERSLALEVIDGAVRIANATVPLIILCGRKYASDSQQLWSLLIRCCRSRLCCNHWVYRIWGQFGLSDLWDGNGKLSTFSLWLQRLPVDLAARCWFAPYPTCLDWEPYTNYGCNAACLTLYFLLP